MARKKPLRIPEPNYHFWGPLIFLGSCSPHGINDNPSPLAEVSKGRRWQSGSFTRWAFLSFPNTGEDNHSKVSSAEVLQRCTTMCLLWYSLQHPCHGMLWCVRVRSCWLARADSTASWRLWLAESSETLFYCLLLLSCYFGSTSNVIQYFQWPRSILEIIPD